MTALRVTVTGATGLIGSRLVPALLRAGARVTILSRDPTRARAALPTRGLDAHELDPSQVEFVGWDPLAQPAPSDALDGRDAVIHLAGENVAQRWSAGAKRAIRDSRVLGTERLIEGLAAAAERPRTLVCSSGAGYYGASGDEPLDEDSPPGTGFLASVCVDWEERAHRAETLGVRVACLRTGVVLDPRGGALARMLTPFRLGLGGPIAGGRHYMPWIHHEDLVSLMLAAVRDERYSGAVNATAPQAVTNGEFTHALAHVLRRPALFPIPALALRALYGEMSEVLTTGARVMPARALVLGFHFEHAQLEPALRSALAQG
jgi:uncharacterized protein